MEDKRDRPDLEPPYVPGEFEKGQQISEHSDPPRESPGLPDPPPASPASSDD